MAQKTNGWNPLNWFKSPAGLRVSRKKTLALETLESREVPAVIMVTNLLDSNNPSFPYPGSLREALTKLANSGDEIRFDSSLFPEGQGTQTLTLNGAVGELLAIQNNISIVGPGRFVSGNNDYKLEIQSDSGFATVNNILNGGSGYRPGDLIDQGTTLFSGGAVFQVQETSPTGSVTKIAVLTPGANSTFSGTLSQIQNGVNRLTPRNPSLGTGLILGTPSLGLTSSILTTQLINSSPQNFQISGIDFGNAKSTTILQNLGNLVITDCLFDSTANTFISTSGGAGSLTVSNTTFSRAGTQIAYGGSGPLNVSNSVFSDSNFWAISGGGSVANIDNCGFYSSIPGFLAGGVGLNTGSLSIKNTYFTSLDTPLRLSGTATKVSDCYFSNNTGSGVTINSGGNLGGGAIYLYGGGSLEISKSLFVENTVTNISNFNSGGGAIFNYNGTLSIDQCGFTGNSISITGYPNPIGSGTPPVFTDFPEQIPSAANSGGGAIYSGGNTTITNSYFNQNKVISTVDFWQYTKIPDSGPPPESRPQYSGGGALYLTSNSGNSAITLSNNTITENSVFFDTANATTVPYINTKATGSGLNGGAIIIASGVNPADPNWVQVRPFNGTTNALLVNNTITNNSLINDSVIGVQALSSNYRTVLTTDEPPSGNWLNPTDTGGLFNNTSNVSSISFLNTILTNNTGITYLNQGKGLVTFSNTGSRYTAGTTEGGNGSISSLGYNIFDNAYSFYIQGVGYQTLSRTTGDLTTVKPIFAAGGLQNNIGPRIGLQTAQPTLPDDQGQGNILTIALDSLSVARDTGSSSVYTPGTPIQLLTDARGVKRLINLAVDMGAYEVQFATQTTIVNPALTPAAPPTYPNPYLKATYGVPLTITAKAQWNDNKVPNTAISGTISLVNADDQSIVYATGVVVPLSNTDFKLGGLAQLVVNTNDLNVLPTGKNNYIALYSGDTNYAISQTNTFTIDVSPAITTTTLDLGQPDVQAPNTSVVFTGTVNYAPSTQVPAGDIQLQRQPAAGGTWTQFATGSVDTTGAFSISGQFPTLGDYNVRALFVTADSSKFNNSTSNSVLQQIGYIPTISLNPFSNPVERGTPVTFTAVVGYQTANGVPTGTVTFQTADGSQTIATVNPPTPSPAGTLTYTVTVDPSMLPLGDNSIVAVYNRNGGSYVTQTSKDETLTLVGRATTTTLSANPVSGVYGSPVEFIATVTPNGPPAYAGGSVEFYAAGTLVQSIPLSWDSSGNPLPVTYTSYGLEAGNLSVVAVYTGDQTNYQGSTSNEVVVDVSKAATQLTLNPSVARVEVGTPVTLTATLTNSAEDPAVQPAGSVDFYRDGVKIGMAALKGNTATIVVTPDQVGTYLYEAKYAGNNNYGASSGSTSVSAFQQVQENFYLVAPQSGPFVQMFNRVTNEQMTVFQPFGPDYTGGFTVAKGDVNNDGVADLLYSARLGGQVQIYDGSNFNPLGAVYPFGPGLQSSLSIAVGDINGDGYGDVIAAPGSVGMPPHVVAISGRDMTSTLFSQYAYSTAFLGGVSVAAGEVNGDGAMDIITAPLVGAPPHIVTFDGKTGAVLQSYYAYSPLYRGGTSIAAADLDGDGFTEIITGASAAAPHVVVVDSRTMSVKASFYAYAPNFGGGVRVATIQDINADGIDDIITSPGQGAGPNVVRFDGKKALQNQAVVIDSFFAYGPGPGLNYYGGTFVG